MHGILDLLYACCAADDHASFSQTEVVHPLLIHNTLIHWQYSPLPPPIHAPTCLTRSTSAPGLSTLLMATRIGTSAACDQQHTGTKQMIQEPYQPFPAICCSQDRGLCSLHNRQAHHFVQQHTTHHIPCHKARPVLPADSIPTNAIRRTARCHLNYCPRLSPWSAVLRGQVTTVCACCPQLCLQPGPVGAEIRLLQPAALPLATDMPGNTMDNPSSCGMNCQSHCQ
jgi:hypothetical protein